MKFLYLRFMLGFLVVLLTSSCLSEKPMIIQVKPCQGEEVDNWLRDTFDRIDEAYNSSSMTTDDLEKLYIAQQNQITHVCMTDVQDLATNIFYHQWQASLANDRGDPKETLDHFTQAKEAYDQMVEELKRLSKEYDWGYDW